MSDLQRGDEKVDRTESVVAAPARGVTLVITNLTKIAGLVVGIHEALATGRSSVLIFAAFLIAGGQLSETALLSLIDRVLGSSGKTNS
jgi:hypothetical protein